MLARCSRPWSTGGDVPVHHDAARALTRQVAGVDTSNRGPYFAPSGPAADIRSRAADLARPLRAGLDRTPPAAAPQPRAPGCCADRPSPALSVLLLFVVSALDVPARRADPGDVPASCSASRLARAVPRAAQSLGLDLPLPAVLGLAHHAVQGDFGTSAFGQQPVTPRSTPPVGDLLARARHALVVALVGISLGVVSALRAAPSAASSTCSRCSACDSRLPARAVLVACSPSRSRCSRRPATCRSRVAGEWLRSLVLPVITLSLSGDRDRRQADARRDARRARARVHPHAARLGLSPARSSSGTRSGARPPGRDVARPRLRRPRSATPCSSRPSSRSPASARSPCKRRAARPAGDPGGRRLLHRDRRRASTCSSTSRTAGSTRRCAARERDRVGSRRRRAGRRLAQAPVPAPPAAPAARDRDARLPRVCSSLAILAPIAVRADVSSRSRHLPAVRQGPERRTTCSAPTRSGATCPAACCRQAARRCSASRRRVVVVLALGVPLGLLAGYLGGRIDRDRQLARRPRFCDARRSS